MLIFRVFDYLIVWEFLLSNSIFIYSISKSYVISDLLRWLDVMFPCNHCTILFFNSIEMQKKKKRQKQKSLCNRSGEAFISPLIWNYRNKMMISDKLLWIARTPRIPRTFRQSIGCFHSVHSQTSSCHKIMPNEWIRSSNSHK